jgi:hypothetical protein
MHSTLESSQTESTETHEVSLGLSAQEKELVARADERLAHAYEQIARADEQLARANEQISKLEPPSLGGRPSSGRPALRGLIGLLLAACIFIAAFAWQSFGETVRPIISRWAPQLASASSLPPENPGLASRPNPPTVEVAAAGTAVSQPSALAETAPQDVAPTTAAPMSPELTPFLQAIARDLANVQHGIEELKTSQEQLKASQEQMARENANATEQLKASQEQMARAIAKVSEQNPQPKASAPAPRPPLAAHTSKPVAAPPSTQARTQLQKPIQLQSQKPPQ